MRDRGKYDTDTIDRNVAGKGQFEKNKQKLF